MPTLFHRKHDKDADKDAGEVAGKDAVNTGRQQAAREGEDPPGVGRDEGERHPLSVAAAGNEGPGDDPRGRRAETPTQMPRRGWKDVLVRTVREFTADNASMVAAAAAFYAWLALLPAILAAVMLYGILASPSQVESQLDELFRNLSADVASTLRQPIDQAVNSGDSGLGIGLVIALAGAVWSASGGMNGLIQGIGIAYDQPDERNFLKKRGLAIVLTLGGIVMFLLMITLIAVLPPVVEALGLPQVASVAITVARFVLLALLMLTGLAFLYRLAPDRQNARFAWVTPGSVVAMVLWLAVSAGFSFYVSNFGSYNKTYGALAGVIILELWLYLTMTIILFGAELNAELEAQTSKDTTTGRARPMGRREAQKADELGRSTA